MLISKFAFITALTFSATQSSAAENCLQIFSTSSFRSEDVALAQAVSQETVDRLTTELGHQGLLTPQRRGYAILTAAMIGSAALTTLAGSHLGPNFQFVSVFLAPLFTLGVYGIGAPIWEPISSKFRQLAFGVGRNSHLTGTPPHPKLEATWLRTQENYSVNAQMSRNLINQYITSVRQNFYEAHRAHQEENRSYSADQVAEAAFRLHTLFKDIAPDDASVSIAVQTAFTNHIPIDADFINLVYSRLKKIDANFESPQTKSYYQTTILSWLGSTF